MASYTEKRYIGTSMELEDIRKQLKDLEKQKQEIDSKLSWKCTVYNEIKQKNLQFLCILSQCSTPNKHPTSPPYKEVNPYSYAPNYILLKLPSTLHKCLHQPL